MATELNPIQITVGVNSTLDNTPQSTVQYVYTDKIRFIDGFPEKIGGWKAFSFDSDSPSILGCARNIFSYILDSNVHYLLATSTSLYHLLGQNLINITPVTTTPVILTDPFATYYGTLGINPITTVSGSKLITITDAAHKVKVGDLVGISGASAVNGIPATDINTNQFVEQITTNTYSFTVGTAATSSGSGGGAAVVRRTSIITVTHAAHGYLDGYNINITGTTGTASLIGGIPVSEFNTYHVIRSVTTNTYDISLQTLASSSTSSKGGTVSIYPQIPVGLCNSTTGEGYGMGLYGVGLYGVAGTATTPTILRNWSFDKFGDLIVTTAGSQTGLYSWDSINGLPTLVTNAPTTINYCFVTDNILVTLGADGVGNRIKWCDQGNLTSWTATPENQAGEDDIEDSDDFISHATVKGVNLIFTRNKVYTFRYIRKPYVFETKLLDKKGLIAQNARITVDGIVYYMGKSNFYMYRGGNIEVAPANTQEDTTIKNYVFNDITTSQLDKIFCWFNKAFNEIWWHYPSSLATEPDRVVRYNIKDKTWAMDTMQRNCAEYPDVLGVYPMLANDENTFYQHENGYNDDTQPLPFQLTTKYFFTGTNTGELLGIIPDSIQENGDITLNINYKLYPQSTKIMSNQYNVTSTTEKIAPRINGRFWQYDITGSNLNQFWRSGVWYEEIQKGSKR